MTPILTVTLTLIRNRNRNRNRNLNRNRNCNRNPNLNPNLNPNPNTLAALPSARQLGFPSNVPDPPCGGSILPLSLPNMTPKPPQYCP